MSKDLEKGIDWVVKEAEQIKEEFKLSGQIKHESEEHHLALKYIEDLQCGGPHRIEIGELYYCAHDINPESQDRLRIEIRSWLENEVIPNIPQQ
jgi:hypothetical protein